MKALTIAAIALALAAAPASAQLNDKRIKPTREGRREAPGGRREAYKAALEKIPSRRKNTIVGVARPADAAKKSKYDMRRS